jgi:hypothetical protein
MRHHYTPPVTDNTGELFFTICPYLFILGLLLILLGFWQYYKTYEYD